MRSRRDRLRITRPQLAARAGCSLTYLQTIEAGIVPARSEVLPRVLAALDALEAERNPDCDPDHKKGSAATGTRGAANTDGRSRPRHAA